MRSHLRFAVRQFAKNPGFTAVIVLTLALGIGANAAIFSIVTTIFLRALPYPQPDRLVHLSESSDRWNDRDVSYPNFLDWHASQDTFSAPAIYRTDGRKLTTPDGAEQVTIVQVSGDFFPAVGVHAARGRDLTPADDRAGAVPVLWLAPAAWRRYFAGAPELVGQTVRLDGQAATVAGILPAAFRFQRSADGYVPLDPFVDAQFMRERANHSGTHVIGRLKPGVTFEAARAQMTAISRRLQQDHPKENAGIGIHLVPLRERMAGWARKNLLLLLSAVGMVLLIACVNIANMLLARSFGRAREMAIHTALGAQRRDELARGLRLALPGVLLGLAGAWAVSRLLQSQLFGVTATDPATYAAGALLLLLLAALLACYGPARRATLVNPTEALRAE